MKFSREIEFHTIPEWATLYIDYRGLKRKYKHIVGLPDHSSKTQTKQSELKQPLKHSTTTLKDLYLSILDEANKANDFFNKKIKQLKSDFESIVYYLNSMHKETSLGSTEVRSLITFRELDDLENRATSTQRTFQELHQHLSWLEDFCEINCIALYRILERAPEEKLKLYVESLEINRGREEIDEVKKRIYAKVAEESMNGNVEKAVNFLLCYKKFKNSDLALISFSVGVLIVMMVVSGFVLQKEDSSDIYPSFCFFRLFFSISMIILEISWMVYLLDSNRIGWLYLLDIPASTKLSYMQITAVAMALLALSSIFMTLNLATIYYFTMPYGNFVPAFFALAYLFLVLSPWGPYKTGRYHILKSTLNSIISPLGTPRFHTYLAASWLPSLIIPLKDIYLCANFYISGSWQVNTHAANNEEIMLIISCFPFISRILQDLRRVYDNTSLLPRLLQGLGRSFINVSIILLAYLGYFYTCFGLFWYVLTTLVLYTFDLIFDWHLEFYAFGIKTQGRGLSTCFYYTAGILDFFLRFFGVASMLPEKIFYNEHVPVDIILLGILLLETVRKTIWSVIRIEREKVDNKDKFRKFDFRKKF